jgi:hypothetical protein
MAVFYDHYRGAPDKSGAVAQAQPADQVERFCGTVTDVWRGVLENDVTNLRVSDAFVTFGPSPRVTKTVIYGVHEILIGHTYALTLKPWESGGDIVWSLKEVTACPK